MQTAEKSGGQLESEEHGEVGVVRIVGNAEEIKYEEGPASITHTVRWKRALAARGADPSTGQAKIDVMNCM